MDLWTYSLRQRKFPHFECASEEEMMNCLIKWKKTVNFRSNEFFSRVDWFIIGWFFRTDNLCDLGIHLMSSQHKLGSRSVSRTINNNITITNITLTTIKSNGVVRFSTLFSYFIPYFIWYFILYLEHKMSLWYFQHIDLLIIFCTSNN